MFWQKDLPQVLVSIAYGADLVIGNHVETVKCFGVLIQLEGIYGVGMGSEGEMSSNYDLLIVFKLLIGRGRNGQTVK